MLLAAAYPWTPLLGLAFLRRSFADRRIVLLLAWLLFGLLFFSLSRNKLPGYLLPLLPALAALLGIALSEAASAKWWLAATALLLGFVPLIAAQLPRALRAGVPGEHVPGAIPFVLAACALAAICWYFDRKSAAVAALAISIAASVVYIKWTVYPILDKEVSARGLWNEISPESTRICLGEMDRGWEYGLNYYSHATLPACDDDPRPMSLTQSGRDRPAVQR